MSLKGPDLSRRRFFRRFAGELVVMADEVRGKPHESLEGLKQLPDEHLAYMRPCYNPLGEYFIEGDELLMSQDEGEPKLLYQLGEAHNFMLSCFDGYSTVQETSEYLSGRFEMEPDAAFECVKKFFVTLAGLAVLIPADPPGDYDD